MVWMLVSLLPASPVAAQPWALCPLEPSRSAAELDRLLLLAEHARDELAARTPPGAVALIARSGLDLGLIGHTLSHAGLVSLQGPGLGWSVRQLYLDCALGRPRLFDQGLAGFVLGVHQAELARISLLWWPPEVAARLAAAAQHDPTALALMAGDYSANAHAWGVQRQNCNQWVAELVAWAEHVPGDGHGHDHDRSDGQSKAPMPDRPAAQEALRALGYTPAAVWVPPPLAWLAAASPWLTLSDHPPAAVLTGYLQLSLPAALEAWVQARHPAAQRVELCLRGEQLVIRRGAVPLPAGCEPAADDQVLDLMPSRAGHDQIRP